MRWRWVAVGLCVGCGSPAPDPASEQPGGGSSTPEVTQPDETPAEASVRVGGASSGEVDLDQEVALELRQEAVFDVLVALPPRAEALDDPPPHTRLWLDPDTGWALSMERRGEGALHPAVDVAAVAVRAAERQGGGTPELLEGRMGDVPSVQADFQAGAQRTSTCVAWRNGSVYLLGITDPAGGEGVSELLRLLCPALTFTTPVQAAPRRDEPFAGTGILVPRAVGLAVAAREDGPGATITDVALGFVTVLAGFPLEDSPYRGLDGIALTGRLESEGCSVQRADTVELAGRSARRARCVLGVGGPRREYALLHVVESDRAEWVVSVVTAEQDWAAAEEYAGGLLQGATLP